MTSLSFRSVRLAFAALFAVMALVAWFAPMPGADPRVRALLGVLLLVGALIGSPLGDFAALPTDRK